MLSGAWRLGENCVADTGPLMHLAEIGRIKCLECIDSIVVSGQVREELRHSGAGDLVFPAMSSRILVKDVSQSEIGFQRVQFQGHRLHESDLSVVALAERLRPGIVLTDDLRLRRALELGGHRAVGSVGVVTRAYASGMMSGGDLREALGDLLNGSSLYTTKAFRDMVYRLLDDISRWGLGPTR